jgi:hypothetical protein
MEGDLTTQTVEAPVTRSRRIGFYTTVGVTVLLIVLGLLQPLTFTVTAWLPAATLDELYGDVTAAIDSHRIHLFGLAIISWLALIPVAVQLWRPVTKVAPAVFALAAYAIVTVVDLVTGLVDPVDFVLVTLGAIILWLHPGRLGTRMTPARRRPFVVALIGAGGWLVFGVIELSQQLTQPATNEHVEFHHFGYMGEIALLIILAALIGATAMTGQRIVAGLSSGAGFYLGLASAVFPDYESSVGVPFGIIAIIWAAAYLWTVLSDPDSPRTT